MKMNSKYETPDMEVLLFDEGVFTAGLGWSASGGDGQEGFAPQNSQSIEDPTSI